MAKEENLHTQESKNEEKLEDGVKTEKKKKKAKKFKTIEKEDGKVKIIPMPDGKEFTPEYQPSGAAKSRGWEKRRVKQEIMDQMTKLDTMTMDEFEALRKDIEEHPERHTVREARLLRYMTREKFIKDYLDRNTGKAPQDIDITSGGKSMNKVTVEHVHRLEEAKKETGYIDGERVEDREQVVEGIAEAELLEE